MHESDPSPPRADAHAGASDEPRQHDEATTISGHVGEAPDASTEQSIIAPTRERQGIGGPAERLRPWGGALRGDPYLLLLGSILILAALLRLFGYNWDEGASLHPDERAIGAAVSGIGLPRSWAEFWSPASPLNPHFSAYGHLPFYATVLFAHFLSFWGHLVGGPLAGLAGADLPGAGIIESGRTLSGLADTGTWFFAFLIGRHIYGRRTGLLAALLGCFTVLHLEFAHMAGVDTYLGFFVMGALYFCVRIVRFGRPRDYVWAGVWIGCAVACKISGLPLLVPLCVAHAYRGSRPDAPDAAGAGKRRPSLSPRTSSRALPANPLLLVLSLACGFATVFVTMPYAFIDVTNWWAQVWGQLQLAQGIADIPFTRKFAGLPAYWYPLQQMIGWTLGPPLGLAAVAGVVRAVWRQVHRRHGGELVLLAWAAVFFGSSAGQYMKYLRYMVPLTPVLVIFAAALLAAAWQWADAGGPARRFPRSAARAVVGLVVLLTVLYGLAYENIYTAPNTRITASRWIATHIPPGAVITQEDWDESVPWSVPGLTVPPYTTRGLTILGPGDNPATTVPMYVQALQTAQYITISSARDYGSVAHQPGRYPYSIRWYQLLFGGKLNFRLEKAFANHPHLWASAPHIWPLWVNDYQAVASADTYTHAHLWYEADQNMSEYDHPPVFIFKRTGPIDPARAADLLTDHGRLAPAAVAYNPAYPMLLPPAVERANRSAPTYDAAMAVGSLPARFPLLSWLIMVEVLGLLALPLVMRACGSLRDGGYGLTKVCGIVVVGYVTWLAASLHVAVYSRGLIVGACGLLLVVSLALGLRPGALRQHLRARWRAIVWVEVVFLCGFLAFVAVRMAYPDLWHLSWGGERTQEISFTNAILRSQYFPPLDPWFAGGTINYYYYGQYLTGMLMKLVGVTVPVGFNLALPTLFGLVLSTAFSIGYNATGRLWAGGAAAALEGVLGNLGPVRQFAALSPTHSALSSWPLIGGLRDGVAGLFAVLTHQGASLPGDFFWTSSRLFPNDAVINEFPIWSFTYGDMHAHVIDEPIVLAVIGLALAASGLGGEGRRAEDRPARRDLPRLLLLGGLIALVAGATGPTNLWDLPTALAVVVIGFGLRGYLGKRRGGWALAVRDMLVPGAVVGILCLVLYRPFYTSVFALSSGFSFIKPQDETEPYLLHLGLPLFVLTSFCIAFLRRTRPLYWAQRALTVRAFSAYYADRAEQLPRLFRVTRAITWRSAATAPPRLLTLHVVAGGALLIVCALVFGSPTLVLIAALLTLVTLAFVEACARWRGGAAAALPFALALAALGLVLTAIPDIVVQNEAGRMNTFFKLYNQAWPLLALSAAVALAALARPRPARVALPLALRDEDARAPAPAALALAVFGRRLFATAQLAHVGGPPSGGEEMVAAAPASHGVPLSPEPGAPPPGQPRDEATAQSSPREGASGDPPRPAPSAPGAAPRAQAPWHAMDLRPLWWGALALLVAGAVLFPIFGTYSHLQLRSAWSQTATARIPNGLDGAAFLRVLYPADAAAIDWINANVRGTPVMATSNRGSYRNFAGKVTMFTGLPSVAPGTSWTYEDSQERYAGQGRPQKEFPAVWVNQFESGRVTWTAGRWVTTLPKATGTAGTRMSDMETLYDTPDATLALSLLREYHVSYIYVGTAERGDANSDEAGRQDLAHKPGFDPVGLAKFDRMAATGQLAVVYHTAGVTIYHVKGIG